MNSSNKSLPDHHIPEDENETDNFAEIPQKLFSTISSFENVSISRKTPKSGGISMPSTPEISENISASSEAVEAQHHGAQKTKFSFAKLRVASSKNSMSSISDISATQPVPNSISTGLSHFRRASLVAFAFASSSQSTQVSATPNASKSKFSRTKTWLRGTKTDANDGQNRNGEGGGRKDSLQPIQTIRPDYSDYICPVIPPTFTEDSIEAYIPVPRMNKAYLF